MRNDRLSYEHRRQAEELNLAMCYKERQRGRSIGELEEMFSCSAFEVRQMLKRARRIAKIRQARVN